MAISIFDFCFRFTKAGSEFYHWDTITPKFEFSTEVSFFELFVPTKETIKYEWMISNSIKVLNPIFLTGVTGTGKTMIINNTLSKL
jgi:dynein heavy chain